MKWQERGTELLSQLTPNPAIHRSDHNTRNSMPYSSRIVCGFLNIPQNLYPRAMRRDLRLIVLIREDLKVLSFADVVTKAALSPQLLKILTVGLADVEPPV